MRNALIVLCFAVSLAVAQEEEGKPKPLEMNLGAGVVIIDSTTYYNLYTRPTYTSDWFGTELYLDLLLSGEGQVRKQDLDWHNIVQNIRLGKVGSNFYPGFGSVQDRSSGFLGMIVSGYGNQYDENNRLSGLVADLGKGSWPLEISGMAGDCRFKSVSYAEASLWFPMLFRRNEEDGGRQEALPIIGATYAVDHNSDGVDTVDSPYDITEIYGAHLAQPFIASNSSFLFLLEGAKINNHGQGYVGAVLYEYKITSTDTVYYEYEDEYGDYQYAGLEMVNTLFSWNVSAAMVRLGPGFEMGFFDSFYERDKLIYRDMGTTKAQVLDSLYPEERYGTYVAGGLNIRNFDLGASYFSDRDYGVDLGANASFYILRSQGLPHFYIDGSFSKIRMAFDQVPGDIFSLDEHALVNATIFYGINRLTGLILSFSWTYVYDSSTGGFVTQQRITPSIYMQQEF